MELRHLVAYALLLLIAVAVPAAILLSSEAWREKIARRLRARRRRREEGVGAETRSKRPAG